jgi:hypothetical protein
MEKLVVMALFVKVKLAVRLKTGEFVDVRRRSRQSMWIYTLGC